MGDSKKYERGGTKLTIGAPAVVELPPRVFRLRLRRALFDSDKTFLRPESLTSIKMLCRFYKQYKVLNVVINGHTDTDYPDPAYNLKLSEQRAAALGDYLQDKVDGWLAWYKSGEWNKKWGVREDQHMLSHLHDTAGAPYLGHPATGQLDAATTAAVKKFQEEHLPDKQPKGTFDDDTRRELIRLYMAEDETTLPADAKITIHGCGLYNLEVQTGPNVPNQANRRVEVFLFEDKVDPPSVEPCAKAGCPYHQWKAKASVTVDLDKEPGSLRVQVIADGKPLEGATVTADGPELLTAPSGVDGNALIPLMVPGEYKVTASKPGFKSVSGTRPVEVSEGSEANDIYVLVGLGKLTVKAVRLSDKEKLVEGATITIKGPTEPQALGQSIAEEKSAPTTKEGVAVFEELQTGTYEIRATHPELSFGDPITTKVVIGDGNTATVELFEEFKLTVLTYNVMFLPTLGALQPIDYFNEERRPLLAAKILEMKADVITFDELFENASREVLLDLIRDEYPNQSAVVDRGPSLEDGGVVVVSRKGTSLDDADQHIYDHDADDDHMAAKGIKYAIVTIGGHRIHFFASHTQADYPEKGKLYPEVRKQQFVEMKQFIDSKNIPKSEPILVCGDLNVDINNGAEFKAMTGTLDAVFNAKRLGWDFTNDETDNDIAKWRAVTNDGRKAEFMFYYDYVLPLNAGLLPTSVTVETMKVRTSPPWRPGFRDLSDHYALLAKLVYRF